MEMRRLEPLTCGGFESVHEVRTVEGRPEVAVVQVRNDNDEIARAILEAKQTIGQFLAAFRDPKPGQAGFHVKVRFEVEDAVEHIWLTDLDLDSKPPSGAIANDGRIPGFDFGKRVTFQKAWVTDWTYTDNGEMVGGYTTKVLMKLRKRQMAIGFIDLLKKRLAKKETVH
jgi:uncharacterized protein YegJ (DUF2314 family)